MGLDNFWIFVSAVTSEFGAERSAIANRLRQQGFQVREQTDFRYEHESDTLLRKLHDYIRECDAVIAIVGRESGTRPGQIEAADLADLLPVGLETPTYTQWEVIFARHYGKRLILLTLESAINADPEEAGIPEDQARFLAWLRTTGLQREHFGDVAALPGLALTRVNQLDWHEAAAATAELPRPVADYLRRIQAHLFRRISVITGRPIRSLPQARRYFVQRRVVNPRNPTLTRLLPRDLLRSAEWLRRPDHLFEELLIVGGAGSGKSTLALSLLAELTQLRNVQRLRLVPLLADCVTLSRMMTDDPSEDDAVIERWLSLAIVASTYAFTNPAGARSDEAVVAEFLSAVDEAGLRLLIVIDGLDELSPADPGEDIDSSAHVERLFQALQHWEARHRHPPVRIATSRPSFANLEGITGLTLVELQPPDARESRRLALALGLDESLVDRFVDMFHARDEIDANLVYFRPLLSYLATHPADAAASTVSRTHLIELEIAHSIDEVVRQLHETVRPAAADTWLRMRLRNLLVLIALNLVDPHDPDGNVDLRRDAISKLVTVAGLRTTGGVEDNRLVAKTLDILVESGSIRSGVVAEPYYRLPHNEHRDYLIADGLLRWITDTAPPDAGNPTTLARLARAYHRLARVRSFVAGSTEIVNDPAFATRLLEVMNDRDLVPDEDVDERSDCSCLGALMTLLLSLPVIPPLPVLRTAGRNFHGLRVPTDRTTRVRLPGSRDWRGASLRDADLSGADLSGLDLTDADLDNCLLSGADLSGAVLVRANLRNVALGRFRDRPTTFIGTVFSDPSTPDSGPDWFNYRIPGLKGYFCFWDLEPVLDWRYFLVSGSRGELLMFGLNDQTWTPTYLLTQHEDDILDVAGHPTANVIATTSRDNTVRLYELPPGDPAQWPIVTRPDGRRVCALRELARLSDVFPRNYYCRRAAFSRSGQWLAITGRDPRVAFVHLPDGPDLAATELRVTVYGLSHTGPVMCLAPTSSHEIATTGTRPADQFYTAGYDGRVVLWSEGHPARRAEQPWAGGAVVSAPATTPSGARDIGRALLVRRGTDHHTTVLVGTEGSRIRVYRETPTEIVEVPAMDASFPYPDGVFALATHDELGLLAVGFATGEVAVYRFGADWVDDWSRPWCRCLGNDDIVRALAFVPDGGSLVVVTWDGRVSLFDLSGVSGGESREPARVFEYPESLWHPDADIDTLRFDADVDLRRSRGISQRMVRYLAQVGKAASGGDDAGRGTPPQ